MTINDDTQIKVILKISNQETNYEITAISNLLETVEIKNNQIWNDCYK